MASVVQDLKGFITLKPDAMQRVVKSPNMPLAIIFLALAQVAVTVAQWLQFQKIKELSESVGLGGSFVEVSVQTLVLRGVLGFVGMLLFAVLLWWACIKWFHGNSKVMLPGFLTGYGFASVLMWVQPVPVLGLLAAIWMVVVYFVFMKHVMGFGFWKTLISTFLIGLLFAVVVGGASSLLGLDELLGIQSEFNFNLDY